MLKSENIGKIKASDFGNKYTKRHICYTNKKRIAINKKMMDDKAEDSKEKIVKLAKLAYDPNSQDVKLMVNMPVIARMNSKAYNIANNDMFTVSELTDSCCVLSGGKKPNTKKGNTIKGDVKEDIKEEGIKIDMKDFQKLFYVAYAITCHKSQGATFNHQYTIHEFNLFDNALKYVALSRSTKKAFINIMPDDPNPYYV
jgi:hypothetical protein